MYMIALVLYALGTLNGIGHTIYIGEYPTAIGVTVLSIMACPQAVKYYRHLFSDDL